MPILPKVRDSRLMTVRLVLHSDAVDG